MLASTSVESLQEEAKRSHYLKAEYTHSPPVKQLPRKSTSKKPLNKVSSILPQHQYPLDFALWKKGGSPCIDYRGLNLITKKYAYSLPLVSSALEQLKEATIYTKLDLRSAYNLVRIRDRDKWKTTFLTPNGHYEYLVMAYKLAYAPSVFQNMINDLLRDMLGKYVIAYIHYILI